MDKSILNYILALFFFVFPIGFLYIWGIISISDKFIALTIGLIIIYFATYTGNEITRQFLLMKFNTDDNMTYKNGWIFFYATSIIWALIVLS